MAGDHVRLRRGQPFQEEQDPAPTHVDSDVTMVVDLGISALPLADGRSVLSSAPHAMVADRLTAGTGIRLTFLVPPDKHSSTA